jgi:MFS family permease
MATVDRTVPRRSTLSALRHADFRLYFAGQLASASGTWVQNIAQGFLVFQLTQSELWLGIVACAAGLPLVLFSPIAGVVVERVPRRRLMLVTQTIQMLLAFILAALTFSNTVQVWHIVVLAFCLGVTNSMDAPARQTFVVEMVGREDLHSGIALNSILNSVSRVLGPATAGIALVAFGPAWCFFLNGLSFLAVIASLLIMHVPFAIQHISGVRPLQQLREGLNYSRQHSSIAPLLLLTAIVGFFALPLISFLPAFASVVLNSPKEGYAVITVAQGVGSVLAGGMVGWIAVRLKAGRVIMLAMLGSGIITYLFSRTEQIIPSALFMALSGLFMVTEIISINTMIQSTVEDQFRGRVLALYTLAFFGLSPFGALLLGSIADYIGVQDGLAIFTTVGTLLSVGVFMRWPTLIERG